MALPYTFNNTSFAAGFFGTDDGGAPTNATHSFGIDDVYTFPVTINGTVSKPGDTVTITYTYPGRDTSTTQTLTSTQYDNSNMLLLIGTNGVPGAEDGTTNRFVLSNVQLYGNPPPAGQTRSRFTDDGDSTLDSYAVPCYATGTLIRTIHGEVAVETLSAGDVAVTASGAHRPIRWIGSRVTDCRRHPRPWEVQPVRVAAHAFGENRPARDLLVSPGHSLCVDVLGEVLVPAMALINGTTIVQEDVDSVTYWHVELDSHDVLLAENMPAESYLEMGNRGFFAEAAVVDLDAAPDAPLRTHADFCRPFHPDGAVVAAVRAQLAVRAEERGWRLLAPEPWSGVTLVADGCAIAPKHRGLSACFEVPADARDLWLVSPTAVPKLTGGGDDRALGLCLAALSFDGGLGAPCRVALDDPRLDAGFHGHETTHRWTNGRARLPAAALEGMEGTAFLRVDLLACPVPRWVAPKVEAAHVEAA